MVFKRLLKADRIVVELFKAIATKLPLSIIEKLADGKITREELTSLIQEIATIAGGVLIKIYNDSSEDKIDEVPEVEKEI